MAARALIVAIQQYLDSQGSIARELPGTFQAALDFETWLAEHWRLAGLNPANTQILFCSEPVKPGGTRARQEDLLAALTRLKEDGQNSTEELFFYFSGHGFSFEEKPGSRADIVITSDFKSPTLSGHCCLKLDEIVAWLRDHLGPGRHYHFVDACRNKLDASKIQIGSLLPIDPQTTGEASTYVLQSTVEGATAAVGGLFPAALLSGLRGKGKAKAWVPPTEDAMYVKYESLRGYLKETLSKLQQFSSRVGGPDGDGESEAILAKIQPVPILNCTVQVENTTTQETGKLFVKRGRSDVPKVRPLTIPAMQLELQPDAYSVSVRLDNGQVIPSDPISLDIYEDKTVVFKKVLGPPPGPAGTGGPPPAPVAPTPAAMDAAAAAEVHLVVPQNVNYKLRNIDTGMEETVSASRKLSLPHGRYFVTAHGKSNRIFKREEIVLKGGETVSLNLANWQKSVPHVSIAKKLPEAGGAVDFSESLGGAINDSDLNLWLAILGGGRILGPQGDYSKISQFPLHDFINEPSDASPIYVLAGFERPDTRLEVALSRGAQVAWSESSQPPDMPGILQWYSAAPPEWRLLSIRVNGGASYTIATLAMPNRAMLITLTLDEDDNPRISQFLLPLGHLVSKLPSEVSERLTRRNQLSDVRFLAEASRAFRKRRNLFMAVDQGQLEELLYAKWLDPIASSLAAYELLRRGRKTALLEVIANMTRFFPAVPDTWALAKIYGDAVDGPRGVPLFFDGLRAFPDYAEWLPLPAGNLDFTSPWTAWRSAVK
jgi:hypothetical protein